LGQAETKIFLQKGLDRKTTNPGDLPDGQITTHVRTI
jgi:hypothetical protein